jgi:hypothetical protein
MNKTNSEGEQPKSKDADYMDYWSDRGLLQDTLERGYMITNRRIDSPNNDCLFKAFEAACLHLKKPLVYAVFAADGLLLVIDLVPLNAFLTPDGVVRLAQICIEYSGIEGQLLVAAPEMPVYGYRGLLLHQIEDCLNEIVPFINNPQWFIPTHSDAPTSQLLSDQS